ncbi:MAG: helix-turn-helix domain-containing protein [Gemmatimonadales bacterium]
MRDAVLVIADEADLLQSVAGCLERIGAEVVRASTGEAGLAAYEREGPDLVVVGLPSGDAPGLDLVERLVARGAAVVLVTGLADLETGVRAMQLGGEYVLTTPVHPPQLAAAVGRVRETVRLRRENERLRAREAGGLALLSRLVTELRSQLPGSPSGLTPEAVDRLLSAPWPGNVRELRIVLERAMLLARGAAQIGVEHLPPDLGRRGGVLEAEAADRLAAPVALVDVERQHIERVLRFHSGNRTRAAQALGISRATLINKIKAYALDL